MPISRNILTLVNEASASASLPELPALFGTAGTPGPTDETVRRLKSVVNDSMRELMRAAPWQGLIRTAQFNVATGASAVPIPDDMDRMRTESFYSEDQPWYRVGGATESGRWHAMKHNTYGSIITRWRFQADRIMLEPAPDNAETFHFEYISSYPLVDVNGYFQPYVTADDDRAIFDDHCVKLDLKWRILREFGEPFASEEKEAMNALDVRKAGESGAGVISYGSREYGGLVGHYESDKVVLG